MIHVCSLARLHHTVEETGARHIVTLLKRRRIWCTRPGQRCRRQAPGARHGRHPRAGRRLCRALRGACREAHRLRARLGPGRAAGRALLCRHQPLDRGRFRRPPARSIPDARSCGSRRSCGSAPDTASPNRRIVSIADDLLGRNGRMVERSMPSGRHGGLRGRCRSGWSSNSQRSRRLAAAFVNDRVAADCHQFAATAANREFTGSR